MRVTTKPHTGLIAATRASWPETIFKDSAVALNAGETVTLIAPLAGGQVLSPLYWAVIE
jgi:hypothetical protein